ncbi:hypothetical protein M569_01120 [Genlisea aurea]|uniref:F-box domain-containing protein n=1 Tax=Genlisea aurea TaxID=192259 RepID=S8ELU0_9LAMI|nr:hypothetical protein M569_01120 [Genlisea aurea]
MISEEILKLVFASLEAKELATCMLVSKSWHDLAKDDYLWKCLCTRRWPSICKKPSPPTSSYFRLYKSFYRCRRIRKLPPPPKLSFSDLEFYIDIWSEGEVLYSEAIPGPRLRKGSWDPPPAGISDALKFYLSSSDYKMTLPTQPRFNVPLGQTVTVSVFVGRNDDQRRRVACIINRSAFDYIDRSTHRAQAYYYLELSPAHPFVSGIRAWISLLFVEGGVEDGVGFMDVFGIELDFCDAADSEDQVLWLLDMLDWQ